VRQSRQHLFPVGSPPYARATASSRPRLRARRPRYTTPLFSLITIHRLARAPRPRARTHARARAPDRGPASSIPPLEVCIVRATTTTKARTRRRGRRRRHRGAKNTRPRVRVLERPSRGRRRHPPDETRRDETRRAPSTEPHRSTPRARVMRAAPLARASDARASLAGRVAIGERRPSGHDATSDSGGGREGAATSHGDVPFGARAYESMVPIY
jgi:hypothetical protein